jgi:Na+/H+-dicarboxylate symporter
VAVIVARVPLRRFARAALPARLIAFSSSSSIASLPALVEAPSRVSAHSIASPDSAALAVSLFKIAAPVSWTVGALFVRWFYEFRCMRGNGDYCLRGHVSRVRRAGIPRGAFIMRRSFWRSVCLSKGSASSSRWTRSRTLRPCSTSRGDLVATW